MDYTSADTPGKSFRCVPRKTALTTGWCASMHCPKPGDEPITKHLTQRDEQTFYLHGSLSFKHLVQSFSAGVDNSSEKVFNPIRTWRENLILMPNQLIILAGVGTPMNLGLIIVNQDRRFRFSRSNNARGNRQHIITGQLVGFGFFF